MGLVPGMPNLIFLSIATLLAVAGYLRSQQALPDVVVEEAPELEQSRSTMN